MKPDRINEIILRDVFAEGFDSPAAKARAMSEFQRGKRTKSIRQLVILAAFAILLFATFRSSKPEREEPALNSIAAKPAAHKAAPPADGAIISDEELLASFPENSCFIAELDGKKVLVFVDANLEREFLR